MPPLGRSDTLASPVRAPEMTDPIRPEKRLTLPKRTTPTWEVELLLSGATVFTLVQLARALPEWGAYLLPRLSVLWFQVANLSIVYLLCGVIVLAVAFVLHLLLRAYWVALVGMDSVFPEGLKAENLRAGPVVRRWVMSRWRGMEAEIEQADNRATIVFGLGIGLARMMVTITVVVTAVMLAALFGAAVTGTTAQASTWILSALALLVVPWFLLLLDRAFGGRLRPGSLAHRGAEAILRGYSMIGFSRESSPLVTLYTTSVGEKRGNWVVGGIITLATVASILTVGTLDDDLGWGQYGEFPAFEPGGPGLQYQHYASHHEPGESPRLPFLPGLQAKGRYLPLVLPYVPRLHGFLLEQCDVPRDRPGRDEPGARRKQRVARAEARGRCLAAGTTVTLDGQPLAQAPELYGDATRDLRGLLYMIPLQGLSRGRHELVVTLAVDAARARRGRSGDGDDEDEAPTAWTIPFWY